MPLLNNPTQGNVVNMPSWFEQQQQKQLQAQMQQLQMADFVSQMQRRQAENQLGVSQGKYYDAQAQAALNPQPKEQTESNVFAGLMNAYTRTQDPRILDILKQLKTPIATPETPLGAKKIETDIRKTEKDIEVADREKDKYPKPDVIAMQNPDDKKYYIGYSKTNPKTGETEFIRTEHEAPPTLVKANVVPEVITKSVSSQIQTDIQSNNQNLALLNEIGKDKSWDKYLTAQGKGWAGSRNMLNMFGVPVDEFTKGYNAFGSKVTKQVVGAIKSTGGKALTPTEIELALSEWGNKGDPPAKFKAKFENSVRVLIQANNRLEMYVRQNKIMPQTPEELAAFMPLDKVPLEIPKGEELNKTKTGGLSASQKKEIENNIKPPVVGTKITKAGVVYTYQGNGKWEY